MPSKTLTIIGSTGSIGKNGCAISQEFDIQVLTCHTNFETLQSQALALNPKAVCVGSEIYDIAKNKLACKVYLMDYLPSVLQEYRADVILYAISGNTGLLYIESAIKNCHTLALANKECIVSAWEFITKIAKGNGTTIIPVDSEHNSLYQLFHSGFDVRGAFITASGGPFFGKTFKDLIEISPSEALKHPNWNMGGKITIDSATMANKALELIEACCIFNKPASFFNVFIERQSLCHAGVYLQSGATIPFISKPDMKLHISHAIGADFELPKVTKFHVDLVDVNEDEYPIFFLGKKIAERNDITERIMFNLANEKAVNAFMQGLIKYTQILDYIKDSLDTNAPKKPTCIADAIEIGRAFQ